MTLLGYPQLMLASPPGSPSVRAWALSGTTGSAIPPPRRGIEREEGRMEERERG
ncbi:hypothetical protein IF1G_01955 [Cordyceps javanica]|uniref:Uncharacterized protein n=1 Tax=Cordyceps javanica TaxID=43265 RepID=A0A545VDE0_9HYPO|nr:hypothetical protein IF1G_01955 [Cordyceps javanica]